MQDSEQTARDGMWVTLMKLNQLHGTLSAQDESWFDVTDRQKAQEMLPQLKQEWVIDDMSLPHIQKVPEEINGLLAALDDSSFKTYPVYDLHKEIPPLIPAITAIKSGDSFFDAAKALDAANLAIVLKMNESTHMFDELKHTPEGQSALNKFDIGSRNYRKIWEYLNTNFAQVVALWMQSKFGGETDIDLSIA